MNLIVKGKPGVYEKISGVVVHVQIIENEGNPESWLIVWNAETDTLETVPTYGVVVNKAGMIQAAESLEFMTEMTLRGLGGSKLRT